MNRLSWILLAFCVLVCQRGEFTLGTKSEFVPTIEATWTDQSSFNEVKITLSKDYYDSLNVEVISDAVVSITVPGTDRVIPFVYLGGTNSYKPMNPQDKAVIGETYQLNVSWDENVYVSEGVMLEPPLVDSVTWSFEEARPFREEGFHIKVYGRIPFEENNNYRIRVIENDTLKNQREDYLLFDDTFGLTFFERGLELGYVFEENDRVRLELFRLNRSAFDFLNQLVNLPLQ